MNREEAQELLIHILMTYEPKDQYGDYDDPEPYEQAITMAIEALSERTGEWEIDAEKMEIRCPKCGEKFRFDDADEMLDYLEYANYCIFCGEKLSAVRI